MKDSDQTILVLIVDDNLQNHQVIGNIVKECGYKAALAQNGQQALNFLEKKQPDLVLLDIMMPEMNGIEVCRKMKEHDVFRDIPVIFITALSDTKDIIMAFDAGGVDYITKPFVKEEVQARINVHVKLKKALQKMANMAVTDEMTGVFNRRYAYEILAREMSFAKREKTTFVLCFVDVDNLKTINDTYGHEAGDQLITEVVKGFKGAIRTSDYLFRMGGDEFLLLLPKTRVDDASTLVLRLNENIHKKVIHGIPIDFSFGFSMFSPNDNISVEELIKKADSEMYDQKTEKKKKKTMVNSTAN